MSQLFTTCPVITPRDDAVCLDTFVPVLNPLGKCSRLGFSMLSVIRLSIHRGAAIFGAQSGAELSKIIDIHLDGVRTAGAYFVGGVGCSWRFLCGQMVKSEGEIR